MAGHSKWAQIKRSKAKIDAQRGASFSKIAREIYVAARIGGTDPAGNFRLRTVIEKAKAASMPLDNIKRAIQRASGDTSTDNFEEIQYEGYGPGGVAVIISALTDNRNRTAGDIRSYFIKCEGNLGETGCVNWMFSQKGQVTVTDLQGKTIDYEELFMLAAELEADDVQETEESSYLLTMLPENLEKVVKGLKESGYHTIDAEISFIPLNNVTVSDEYNAKKIIKLIDLLEAHDDVQSVYSNFELTEDLLPLLS